MRQLEALTHFFYNGQITVHKHLQNDSSEGEKEETEHEQIPSTESVKAESVVFSVGSQSVAFYLSDCQHSINKRLKPEILCKNGYSKCLFFQQIWLLQVQK